MIIVSASGAASLPGTPFEGGSLLFEFKERSIDSRGLTWSKLPGGKGFKASSDGLELRCLDGKSSFSFEVLKRSPGTLHLCGISLRFHPSAMESPLETADWLEYIHPLYFEVACAVKKVGARAARSEPDAESSMLYLLANRKGGESLLFSTTPPHRGDFMRFKALHSAPHLEGSFGLQIRSEQERALSKGQAASTSPLSVVKGSDPLKLLERAGDLFASERKPKQGPSLCGWNSWDYFAGAVSSKDIFSNLKAAKRLFKGRLTHFVIDEGYEPRWGVWDANWKFPEGLDGYCEEIRKAGCVPGIWTAPTMVNAYTDMFREHPEYFARSEDGQVAQKLYSYGPMGFLDITHPDVERFIKETFIRLKKAGFGYFKVDFTQECVLNAKLFHDRSIPRGMILRKVFEAIRSAIGDDSYLLACGAPYESVTGLVDACRVSGDIHNFWGHVCFNASSIAGRWWMHGKLWRNDPDFLIVRTSETCSLPRMNRPYSPRPLDMKNYWLAGRELNLQEAKVYALLLRLSAGELFLSDDLASLNAKGVEILEKATAKPLSAPAIPVDLFAKHDALPSVFLGEDCGRLFVGLFNWTEDPKDLRVDLKAAGLKLPNKARLSTFWGDFKGELSSDGALSASLPPRSCEGFLISASN